MFWIRSRGHAKKLKAKEKTKHKPTQNQTPQQQRGTEKITVFKLQPELQRWFWRQALSFPTARGGCLHPPARSWARCLSLSPGGDPLWQTFLQNDACSSFFCPGLWLSPGQQERGRKRRKKRRKRRWKKRGACWATGNLCVLQWCSYAGLKGDFSVRSIKQEHWRTGVMFFSSFKIFSFLKLKFGMRHGIQYHSDKK